ESLAETLHYAAVHLAVYQQRINNVAAIVDRNITLDLNLPGIAVDLRNNNMCAERECEIGRLPEIGSDHTRLGIWRQFHGAIRRTGDLCERDALAGLVVHALAARQGDIIRLEQHFAKFLELDL